MSKKMIFSSLLVFFTLSCSNSSSNNDAKKSDDMEGEKTLASTYIILDGDTLYLATASAQPIFSGQPYRYQINFATKAELKETNSDGGVESRIALVMSFKNKANQSANFKFTNNRFSIDSLGINFYQSHFLNRGTDRDGKNYLSPNTASINVTIENAKFTASLDPLKMTNESDSTDFYMMSGNFDLNW